MTPETTLRQTFEIEATVTTRYVAIERWFVWASILTPLASIVYAFVGNLYGHYRDSPDPWADIHASEALFIGFVLWIFFALLSFSISLGVRSHSRVVVLPQRIGIQKSAGTSHKRVIERSRILNALVVMDQSVGVELTLKQGITVHIEMPHIKAAEDLAARLGFGPDERRVNMLLATPQRQLAAGCISLPLGFFATGIIAFLVMDRWWESTTPNKVLFVLGVVGCTLFAVRWRHPYELVVGRDGFLVIGPFGKTYFSYSAADDLLAYVDELWWNGKIVARGDPYLVRTAVRRIENARNSHLEPRDEASLSGLLDKGARSASEWRQALQAFAKGSGYRHAAITLEQLRALLENPKADSEKRVAAAMLLRISNPADTPRIRVAANACADDDLRAALEAAAEDEVNDVVLKRIARE